MKQMDFWEGKRLTLIFTTSKNIKKIMEEQETVLFELLDRSLPTRVANLGIRKND